MKKLALLFILSTFVCTVQAQQIDSEDLGYPENFPDNGFGLYDKSCIIADDDGTIWYGSKGFQSQDEYAQGGLVSYNSSGIWDFYVTENSGIPSDSVLCLSHLDGSIYCGTSKGVGIFSENWETISIADGLPSNLILSILASPNALYVGTDQGLAIQTDGLWAIYNTGNSGLLSNRIQSIVADQQGLVWIGSDEGLQSFDGSDWVSYTTQNSGLRDNNITSIKIDPMNILWIGTLNGGIHRKALAEIEPLIAFLNAEIPEADEKVSEFDIDEEGRLFCSIKLKEDYSGSSKLSSLTLNGNRFGFIDFAFRNIILLRDDFVYYNFQKSLYRFHLNETERLASLFPFESSSLMMGISSTGNFGFNGVSDIPLGDFPLGSGLTTIFTGQIWLGGKDAEGNLHLAAERFAQNGKDFQYGPIMDVEEVDYNLLDSWNRVWEISREEIDFHKINYADPEYNMPEVISSWPANGDTDLGQTQFIAPYMDVQGNGVYEPLQGDYPVIRGDKAMFFVFNDQREHLETDSLPMGVEIRGMLYAFDSESNEALKNTLFLNYRLVNRSEHDYDSVYLGQFTDFDIGFAFDDYYGCDTNLNAFFGYNATPIDEGTPFNYGDNPPVQAVSFLNNDLDVFVRPINSGSGPYSDPDAAGEYYNFMKGLFKDGSAIIFEDQVVTHMFPGDPTTGEGWSEISAQSDPDDARGVGSTYIGSWASGESFCFDMALVFARLEGGDYLSNITTAKQYIQEVQTFFEDAGYDACSDLIPTNTSETDAPPHGEIKYYPNPFSSELTIDLTGTFQQATYVVYDLMGREWQRGHLASGSNSLQLHNLKSGVYFVLVSIGENRQVIKVMKN